MVAGGPSDYEVFANYFKGAPKSSGPGVGDVAKFIVLNAKQGPGASAFKSEKPSLMSRIFDILSRPNYAVAEFAREWIETGDPDLAPLWEGFSGQKKTTFSKVLEQAGMPDIPERSFLGLGLDIAADPLNLAGVGIAKGISKLRPTEEIAQLPYAQQLLNKGEPAFPESFGLPQRTATVPEALKALPQTTPKLPVPSILPKSDVGPKPGFTLVGEQLPLDLGVGSKPARISGNTKNLATDAKSVPSVGQELKGQVPIKFPGLNIKQAKAENIIDDIVSGDLDAAKALTPRPSVGQIEIAPDLQKHIDRNFKAPKSAASDTFGPNQQVSLWSKSLDQATKDLKHLKPDHPQVTERALSIFKSIENTLLDRGYVPRMRTGENVRLSDVITDLLEKGVPLDDKVVREFSSRINAGSEVGRSVEALRARGAIEEGPKVQQIGEKIGQSKLETAESHLLSDAQKLDFDKFLKKFGKATAKAEGVSPAGISATEKIIDFTLRAGQTPAQVAIQKNAKIIEQIVSTGKANPKANHALTLALEKDLGVIPKWSLHDNKAVESFMGRVATWWGQKDLRPLSLNQIGAAATTAQARGKALHTLMEPFDQAQRHSALQLAQGFGTATNTEVGALANQIKRMMDNLVGNVQGTSVLLRSGVDRNLLNKWMKRYGFKEGFVAQKVTDKLGNTVDYSKGTDWANSWKTFDVKEDPEVFLFKIQQAMEQATREKALFDEIGERFGSQFYGKDYTTKIEGYPYLNDYYFPADIAKQLPRVVRDWSNPSWTGPQAKLLKHYDRLLSMWKSGVTIYRPGHHIRNMAGDAYLGWMDGVNTIRPYMMAAKVQRMMGNYTDLSKVDDLVEIGAISRNFRTPRPNEILFHNKSGVPFTAEQIGAVAHQKGLLESAKTLEDIIDMGESGKGILNVQPFGGRVQKLARGASELQSHNARLAHFIDKVQKSTGKDIATIFEQAARRARKWHPSGLDLTPFEKKVMRRIMPFYSWMRKSLPLLLEGMVMNPAKVLAPSKITGSIQETQGIETQGRGDPFPVDQMFPEWIRAQGFGPLSAPDGLLGEFSAQQPPGYVMAGVGLNPLSDLMAQFESPGKTIGSAITPALKIPAELLFGQKMFTGEPITGPEARPDAMEQYIGEQIPIYSAFQGVTGITPFGTETKKVAQGGSSAQLESLVNWLTAAGIKGTGSYQKQAYYEEQAPIKAQKRAGKEQALEQLRKELGL